MRFFPLLGEGSMREIPWDMIVPFEYQAKTNHDGQGLERLAQRGGLSAMEAIAVLDGKKFCDRWPVVISRKELDEADLELIAKTANWLLAPKLEAADQKVAVAEALMQHAEQYVLSRGCTCDARTGTQCWRCVFASDLEHLKAAKEV